MWKTLSSKIVYKNSFIKVQEDKVIRPNGKSGIYGFLKVPRTVGIVAVDEEKRVFLCKQYRYIFKEESLEIPRGFVDYGESPQQAATRELEEEAGVIAESMEQIGSLRLSIGLTDEEVKIFFAKVASTNSNNLSSNGEIDEVIRMLFHQAIKKIKSKSIIDGLTVSAILMAKELLNL